jgi:hypothetical protein
VQPLPCDIGHTGWPYSIGQADPCQEPAFGPRSPGSGQCSPMPRSLRRDQVALQAAPKTLSPSWANLVRNMKRLPAKLAAGSHRDPGDDGYPGASRSSIAATVTAS